MDMSIEQAQGRVPVTVLGLDGDLDASNFEDVIAKARELYQGGTRYILVDMSNLRHMSSSGLVALHNIATLMTGRELPELESGWEAFHSIARDRDEGMQCNVKLCSPRPNVARTLSVTGMAQMFEIHPDRQTALASF